MQNKLSDVEKRKKEDPESEHKYIFTAMSI